MDEQLEPGSMKVTLEKTKREFLDLFTLIHFLQSDMLISATSQIYDVSFFASSKTFLT
jgi:hypothetical protein